MVPVFRVRSLAEALPFYRDVLGFVVHRAMPEDAPFYAVLSWNGEELHLQQEWNGESCRNSALIRVADAHETFETLKGPGFRPPDRPASPVHCGPVDQTWGAREFYVDDPSGNTICFAQELPSGGEARP